MSQERVPTSDSTYPGLDQLRTMVEGIIEAVYPGLLAKLNKLPGDPVGRITEQLQSARLESAGSNSYARENVRRKVIWDLVEFLRKVLHPTFVNGQYLPLDGDSSLADYDFDAMIKLCCEVVDLKCEQPDTCRNLFNEYYRDYPDPNHRALLVAALLQDGITW